MLTWLGSLFNRPGGSTGTVSNVPEIDASTGLLALAAVAVALMIAWERRRRAARAD